MNKNATKIMRNLQNYKLIFTVNQVIKRSS